MSLRSAALAAWITLALSAPHTSFAQCDCDHTIGLEERVVNGVEMGVQPGERVCVTAGEREFLRLESFQGTAEAPVVITNCGGVVRIHNEERAYALVLEEDSHHVHITGTGDPEAEYGFVISAPATEPYPGVGLWLLGRSSDYEVDHMEIFDTGFAGVSAKTDPLCDGSADQGRFTQRNTHIHHLYVHDVGGEGFYIGSTQAEGQRITCDGEQVTRQPHFLEGLEVHDNIIERTGWDGAQIGFARTGCRFYRNVIRDVGLEGVQYQQQGLQIGAYSACEIFSNVLERGPTNGIFILGAYDTLVHNNVVRDFGDHGIYANQGDYGASHTYRFHFNSILDSGEGNGLTVFGGDLAAAESSNNLVIGPEPGIDAGRDVNWTAQSDAVYADIAAAGLVAADDFRLTEGSPLAGAGVAVEGIDVDLQGFARPDPPSIGAYEAGSEPDEGWTPPPPSPAPEAGDEDCACASVRASSSRSAGSGLVFLALLFVARRRRG